MKKMFFMSELLKIYNFSFNDVEELFINLIESGFYENKNKKNN